MSEREPPDVERLRAALAELAGEPGSEPVDAGRIFDAVHARLSAEERRRVVEQLAVDPEAALAWRLARELAPPEDRAEEVPRTPVRRPWLWALAAAVLAFVLVGGFWLRGPSPGPPVYRGNPAAELAPQPASGGQLSRAAAELGWTALPGAKYHLRVLTPDLEVIAEPPELSEPRYRLEEAELARLPPGSRLLWQVEARTLDGRVVVSPTWNLELP
ncbi:MAG: hypothetical protein U0002_01360 [Thermoanaerobaculia bacterium]